MTLEADAQVQATPQESPSPSPAPVEPKAPAADAGQPANPPAPKAEKSPSEEKADRHKAIKDLVMAKLTGKGGEKPAPAGETAADQAAANPDAVADAPEQSPKDRKPEPPKAATPKPEPRPEKWEKSHVIKAGDTDKDGKPVDVTITYRQAVDALAKARFPGDYIARMTDKDVFEIGSQQYILQRDNNRRWNEAQGRRAAGPAQAETAPAAPPAEAPKASPAEAAAQPAGQPPAAKEPGKLPWNAKLEALREQAGPEVAETINGALAEMYESLRSPSPEKTALESEIGSLKQQQNGLINLLMEERFDRAFAEHAKDYPQLAGDGSGKTRQEFQQLWNSIASSGRYQNPLSPGEFGASFRETLHAMFGNQIKETTARQLLQSQQRQSAGQVAAAPSRAEAPPQALSQKDVIRKAVAAAMRTGSIEDGRRAMAELQAQLSG